MLKQPFFKTIFLITTFHLLSIAVLAQQKYWLEFNIDDFNTNSSSIERLKDSLQKQYTEDLVFHYQSRWSPIVSISTKEKHLSSLAAHGFVKSITSLEELQPLSTETLTPIEYSYALEQIKAHFITDSMKLSGKGVKIGVIDGGFMDADAEPSLKHLIENEQIKFFQDYLLKGNDDPFYGKRISQDDHGTQVLRMIAGSDNGTSINYGMATKAELYLARTDHGIRERRIEEDYWVAAIELFHEMGIRLVNSSLGYTDGYDKKQKTTVKKK